MKQLSRLAMILGLSILFATNSALATDDVVINEHGIAVKLITRRDSTSRTRPDPAADGAPVPAFQYCYVLPPTPGGPTRVKALPSLTENGFYRVAYGKGKSTFFGWISEDDVVEWHHRQALRFSSRKGRALARFDLTEESAIARASGGRVGEPLAQEPDGIGDDLIVMPITRVSVKEVDEMSTEFYEVAFMAHRPSVSDGPTVTRAEATEQSTVDIVFVLDTTASMEQPIASVLASIEKVAQALSGKPELKARLRFGLVGYRDTVDDMGPSGMEYLSRVFCDLDEGADHQVFLRHLRSVTVAKVSSGGYPEDALAGIDAAINLDRLKWNPYGWKQIIVVGDSSIKGPMHPDPLEQYSAQGRTLASIEAKMQPGTGEMKHSNFVLSVVRIKDDDALGDHAVADQQFNTLIAGREHSGEMVQRRISGGRLSSFSDELMTKILEKIENYRVSVLNGSGPEGDPMRAGMGKSSAQFPYPLLELLASLPEEEEGKSISFKQGYCAEIDEEGNNLFVPSVFVRRGQLRSFNSIVSVLTGSLEDAGDPGSRDVQQVVLNLQMTATALNTAEPFTSDMELHVFMNAILGFPIKSEIFKVTPASLAAMNQADYDDWVKEVETLTHTLSSLLENAHIWRKLHPSAKERDEHAFVAITDLP